MAGIGAITVTQYGAVTAPVPFGLAVDVTSGKTSYDHGLYTSIGYPGGRGLMFANGMNPLRHINNTTVLRTGLLAPKATLTATPTGSKAAATLSFDTTDTGGVAVYNPAANEWLYFYRFIQFSTDVSSIQQYAQVLIGADGEATVANLLDYINQTPGTAGVTWSANSYNLFPTSAFTITSASNWTITATYNTFGAIGNTLKAYLGSGTFTNCSLGSTGATVGTVGYFAGGADGTGTNPGAGTYRYRAGFYRDDDGAESGISPQAEAINGADQNIGLTALPDALENDDITHKRWWRTLNDGSQLYVGDDVKYSAATDTDTDTISNTTLATHAAYDANYHRTFEAGMIERVRCIVEYKGRWIGGGFIGGGDLTAGTAAVTAGSNAITITGGYPTKEMEHWTFNVTTDAADDSRDMEIVWVDEDANKIYVHADWEGAANATATYRIRDTRDPFRLYYCEPVLPNQTSPIMFLDGVQGPDKEGITAMVAAFESVIIFTRTGMWRLTGSEPVNFRLTHEYEGVGCVGPRAALMADGTLYWLASDGIYGWAGGGEPYKISNPPTGQETLPRGISRTVARVNQTYAHNTFAHYDPEARIIRWFVPLDTDVTNRNALVFDLQTSSWALDTAPDVTFCATLADLAGNLRTVAGDIHGHLWELDVSTSDGAFGFEPVQTVQAGATANTFSVAGTPLPTTGSGLSGVPVTFISSTGVFTRARVASNTSSVVTLTTYQSSVPSGTVVFGGIHQIIESGRYTFNDSARRKIWEAETVDYAYQSSGQYWLCYAVDQGDPTTLSATGGLITGTDGSELWWVRNEGNRFKLNLTTIGPGFSPAFQRLQSWVRI